MNSGSSGAKDSSSAQHVVSNIYPIVEATMPRTARNWAYKQFFTPLKIKFRKEEVAFLKTSKSSFFDFNTHKIALYEWGEGPTVIMQHGWSGKGVQFIKMIEALSSNGFHVVAFDAPSHGNSTGEMTSAFEFIEVIKVLDKMFGPVHTYIGHSMGGLVLLNVLASGVQLKNIILLNAPSKSTPVMDSFLGILGGSQKTGQFIRDYVQRKYRRIFDSLFSPRIEANLTKKILVIHDKKDRQVTFDNIEKTKKLLPQAAFHFIEGLGHTRILYDKNVVDVVLKNVCSHNQ